MDIDELGRTRPRFKTGVHKKKGLNTQPPTSRVKSLTTPHPIRGKQAFRFVISQCDFDMLNFLGYDTKDMIANNPIEVSDEDMELLECREINPLQ